MEFVRNFVTFLLTVGQKGKEGKVFPSTGLGDP
jgi:hypothetical protein